MSVGERFDTAYLDVARRSQFEVFAGLCVHCVAQFYSGALRPTHKVRHSCATVHFIALSIRCADAVGCIRHFAAQNRDKVIALQEHTYEELDGRLQMLADASGAKRDLKWKRNTVVSGSVGSEEGTSVRGMWSQLHADGRVI